MLGVRKSGRRLIKEKEISGAGLEAGKKDLVTPAKALSTNK